MKGYEIWIDGYYHMSGGIRALHSLRDELVARNIPAWMKYDGNKDPNCIGVYPEVISDNPQGYANYVRWLLNTADFSDDVPIYAWEVGMGDYPLLTVNIVEMDLWKPYEGRRSGVAYWVGKGQKDLSLVPDGAEEITRNNYTTRSALAERIRSLDYLISFDPFTAVVLEAVLSGTPVLVHGKHRKMSEETLRKHSWTPYGVAWNAEEMDSARETVHLAYDHYESLLPVFAKRIDDFVEQTQRVFR